MTACAARGRVMCRPQRLRSRIRATASGETCWVFSYGANMSASVLARRGVSPLATSPAVVHDHDSWLSFRHRAGFATLTWGTPPPGSVADLQQPHGLVQLVTAADLKRLQRAEAGYSLRRVGVRPYPHSRPHPAAASAASTPAEALAFVSNALDTLPRSVAPRQAYLQTILAGATAGGLDAAYCLRVAALPTHRPDGRGLGPQYYSTPGNSLARALLAAAAVAGAGAAAGWWRPPP